MLHWLPEFALKYEEWRDMSAHNAVELLGHAARTVYTSPKYQGRGEFGELLLHAMIRQRFASIPAISKYYYKDSANDTVKGFDAVHVVGAPPEWELWLGEVKFYAEIGSAIRDVIVEIAAHSKRDYLRSEFGAITRKLDDSWPHAAELRQLLHANTSLDSVFARVCIPVLLTYDSPIVGGSTTANADYVERFTAEVLAHHSTFATKLGQPPLSVRLFLFPLKEKRRLVELLDEALKRCQLAL